MLPRAASVPCLLLEGMIEKNTLTRGWKIMNMAKLGIVLRSNTGIKNTLKTAQTRMDIGLPVIHYANIKVSPTGTETRTVWRLTYRYLHAARTHQLRQDLDYSGRLIEPATSIASDSVNTLSHADTSATSKI